jgi:hypothetical protein
MANAEPAIQIFGAHDEVARGRATAEPRQSSAGASVRILMFR